MAEQYAHLLMPRVADFAPRPQQLQAFVSAMVARGVIPGMPTLTLLTPSGRTREGRNPITGGMVVRELKDRRALDDHSQLAEATEGLADYEVEVAGTGLPALPPMVIDFDGPYHVGLICHSSSKLRCTSDPDHGWERRLLSGPFYGKPCEATLEVGLFQNPHTGESIRVRAAGCARFWVEFELGKFLFPRIEGDDLEILDRRIVTKAESLFGVPFEQGCHWA